MKCNVHLARKADTMQNQYAIFTRPHWLFPLSYKYHITKPSPIDLFPKAYSNRTSALSDARAV